MSKTKAITKDIIENGYTRRILFRFLIGALISLGIIYFFLIGLITFNILARNTLENTAKSLNNNVSELELVYLNKTREINKTYALSKGFVEVRQSIFASRPITQVAIR